MPFHILYIGNHHPILDKLNGDNLKNSIQISYLEQIPINHSDNLHQQSIDLILLNQSVENINSEELDFLKKQYAEKQLLFINSLFENDFESEYQLHSISKLISMSESGTDFVELIKTFDSNNCEVDDHYDIKTEIYGILSCVSDCVLIFNKQNTLQFENTSASILLSKGRQEIITKLISLSGSKIHTFEIPLAHETLILQARVVDSSWFGLESKLITLNDISDHETVKRDLQDKLNVIKAQENKLSEALEFNQSRMNLMLRIADEGYWDWIIHKGEVFFSERWKKMLGYSENEQITSFHDWIKLIHPKDLGKFLKIWTDYMDDEIAKFSMEYRLLCKDEVYLWVEVRGIKELDQNGDVFRMAGTHIDIHERKEAENKIKQYQTHLEKQVKQRTRELELANQNLARLAKLDPLTNLYNRRALDAILQYEHKRMLRAETQMVFIIIDIDHFKSFNDQYGHQVGDKCLQAVSSVLLQSINRPTDMVARFGGEEFAILLPLTDIDGGKSIALSVRENVATLDKVPKCPATGKALTVSMGMAFNNSDIALTVKQLIANADQALYDAKNKGRNKIIVHK